MTGVLERAKHTEDGYICEFGYWHSNAPNAEMLEAMRETEALLRDPNAKTFYSMEELLADLNSDDEDDDVL